MLGAGYLRQGKAPFANIVILSLAQCSVATMLRLQSPNIRGEFFIDRSFKTFDVILSFLRDGRVIIPSMLNPLSIQKMQNSTGSMNKCLAQTKFSYALRKQCTTSFSKRTRTFS
mmetsp:Transcript_7705/g.12325  ORF Transcript_7705/g.12325 Transcript_7705/m.12325 type:complete len:114 (-) Transcript_7705:865-1206(-)